MATKERRKERGRMVMRYRCSKDGQYRSPTQQCVLTPAQRRAVHEWATRLIEELPRID